MQSRNGATPMTNDDTIVIVWFDDETDRKERTKSLSDKTGCTVEFVDLRDKDVVEEARRVLESSLNPTLVLVDHVLSGAKTDSSIKLGTSIVPMVREKWKDTPILALTAAYDECVSNIDSDLYEDVIRFEQFSSFTKYAPSIVHGYQTLENKPHNVESLMKLLGVPELDQSAITSSLPTKLKDNSDSSFRNRVFRWFRRQFHNKPGFLWDQCWAALALGVRQERFDQYKDRITEAKYKGIFADDHDPRWWKARLYSVLLPDSSDRFNLSLQQAAQSKFNIPEQDASKCYFCKENWPEVMGYTDEAAVGNSDPVPLHLRCSTSDPQSSPEPYYEEPRIMREE